MVTESSFKHPFGLTALTVYVMDEVGVEIGLRLPGLSRKVEGIHVTVPFVTTSNSAEAPMQILVSGETAMEFSNTSKVT